MNKALIRHIAWKEGLDGVRDRRALFSALLFPFFGPFIIAIMLHSITSPEKLDKALELPIAGSQHAPALIAHLESAGVEIKKVDFDEDEKIASGSEELILEISPDFRDSFTQSRPAAVTLVLDESRIASKRKSRQVRSLLSAYEQPIAQSRLLLRGVDPSVTNVVSIQQRNLATPQTKGANILEMVVMFALMASFICNMYIAIDATAGERERGSLEPLLLTPVSRADLVVGKWLATILFGMVGVFITLLCTTLVMQQVPLEVLGMRLVLGPLELGLIALCFLPLVMLAGAFQLFCASFARSFKEAQTYLSIVLFLPMLPGMYLMFEPANPALWMSLVPAMSQQVFAGSVLRGTPLGLEFFAISVSSAVILAVLFLWLTIRLFRSESFFFKS